MAVPVGERALSAGRLERVQSSAALLVSLCALAVALSLVVERVEWLLAADDAERPHAAGERAVVVLGYRLDWPEGTPVRPATCLPSQIAS